MELKNKNVLITGGAKRIGRAIAIDLASQGANIVIHYLKSSEDAKKLKSDIEKKYCVKVFILKADLTSQKVEAVVHKMVSQIKEGLGEIDILINNASFFKPTPFEKIQEKEWDAFQSIHLKAPFFLSKVFGLRMKKRKQGKIINLVDTATCNPHPDFLPYITSKAGLRFVTVGLAKALAPYVQVNSIAPGPILPPLGASKAHQANVIKGTLLKRFGDPSDIVATVNYLISGTDYVTGVMIPVDGGSSIV